MLKRWMKNQKGFTLVELLAVIVILGIIAAIAIPAIGHIIDKTDKKATVSEAVQIIDAAKLYVASEGTPEDKQTLGNTDLKPYLDHVTKANSNFEVTVTNKDDTLTYEISGTKANEIVNKDPATEEALLKYLGKDISEADSGSGEEE